MKRKLLITIFLFALTAGMVCGCGNRSNQNGSEETNPATVEATGDAEAVSPTAVPETTATPENTAVPEATAEPEESKETQEETEATPTPEPDQAPESASTEAPAENDTPATENEGTVAPTEQEASYTVTEMSATMYAQNAVNLRQGPGTGYAKVGNLTKGQQVTVTGQADNGWYQLDNGAFVSKKYLGDTAPAQQTANNAPADTVITEGTEKEAFGGISVDFINYLNQQRTAAGLSALVWDDNLAAAAQRRAQELTVDNSHNGCPADCSEIIYMGGSSYTDWYNAWYNSQAHRENMFREDHGTAACAYYYQNYNYYVVTLFKQREKTQEELDAIMNPDNMVQIGNGVYIDQETYDALINSGIDPSEGPDEETLKKMEEQQKLLDQGIIDRVIE